MSLLALLLLCQLTPLTPLALLAEEKPQTRSVLTLNRRIGEFLKELDLTEGRSTGVPKILRSMTSNGSPPPEFESDDDRTYFLIRLPVHTRAERVSGAGTPEVTPQVTPEVTPQLTPQVESLLLAVRDEMLRSDLMEALGLRDRMHFVREYLRPALESGVVEMTVPNKPNSSKQRYRLSPLGRDWLKKQGGTG